MERAERTLVNFFDLNGDGVPELVAQPIGPDICGAANCPLYVFQKTGTNYRVILKKGLPRVSLFREPGPMGTETW